MLNLPQPQQEQLNFASFFQSINPAINPNLNHGFPQPVHPSGYPSESNGDDQGGAGLEAGLKSQIVAEMGDYSNSSTGGTVINLVGDKSAISSSLCNIAVSEDPDTVLTKAKLSQLVRCEVCNIDFNSSIVYTSHMAGKKHRKKSEMLNIVNTTGGGAIADAVTVAFAEGLEKKVQKFVEGSWTVVFMRFCSLCDAVCNNQDMYDQHLAGKKHAAQARKMTQDVKELSVAPNTNSISGGGPDGYPQSYDTGNRNKTPMDRFTWCEVCNISCTSKDVLDVHKQAKKHMRNMKKVNTISSDPLIGQMEELSPVKADESNSDNIGDSQAMIEDSERKIMEGSVEGSKLSDSAPDKSSTIGPTDMKDGGSEGHSKNKGTHKIASCDVCGIYCTSQDLLSIHKLGKKHRKKQEKLKTETNASISTPIDAPASTVPELKLTIEHVANSHMLEDDSEMKGIILQDSTNKDELNSDNADAPQEMTGDSEMEKSKTMEEIVAESKPSDSVPDKNPTVLSKDMKEGGPEAESESKVTHKIASCDVCNIYCTSENLLSIHKLGKKHLKKQEKLKSETNISILAPIVSPASMNQNPWPNNEVKNGNVTRTQAFNDDSETNIAIVDHSGKEDDADLVSVCGISPTVLPLENGSGELVIDADKVNIEEFVTSSTDIKTETINNKADIISANQLTWCEVCNICCNSKDVLARHKSGKKHIKKLEKAKSRAEDRCDSNNLEMKTKILECIQNQDEVEKPVAANLYPVHGASALPEENKNGTIEISQEASKEPDNKTINQFLQCEVCGIYCNSIDVLAMHKSGKKHLKKMEKIKTDGSKNVQATLESCDGTKNQIVIESQGPEKELEGMMKPESSQIQDVGPYLLCTTCKVYCNSQVVLDSHLAGQKHTTAMRKLGNNTAGYWFAVAR